MSRLAHQDLRALYDRGKAAWPDVPVALEAFEARVHGRIEEGQWPEINAADLYLSCACAAGDPTALAHLEQHYVATLDPALARLEKSGASPDDVKQILRERFLTRVGERSPKIADYSGLGDLRTWLRVAAVRIAISLARKHRREAFPGDEAFADMPAQDPSPELAVLEETYRAEFDAAFRSAFRSLSARDRNLLRHQVLDRLSIDRIGALYGVHRATAARWVARARDALIKGVKRALQSQLAVGREELDSILRLIQSRVDISLRAFLTTDSADG